MVAAPNPDTAVGWTGHVICDEVGRMPNFKELMEALNPIISSNPNFRFRWATTPPPDERHYSRTLLAPPASMEFEANPEGNEYTSISGIPVHRVDAWDAFAAGVPIYDFVTGEALDPIEARKRALDKADFDRNFMCQFLAGGTSAIPLALAIIEREGALDDVRAAGIYVQVTVGIVRLQGITLGLRFDAGADVDLAALNARGAVVAYVNGLPPGAPLLVANIIDQLRPIPGLVVTGAEVLSPAGDVIASPLEVIRTALALVVASSLQPDRALQGSTNPDAPNYP